MRSLPLASTGWQFRDASQGSPWHAARVPGCVHTDLRRHGLIPDPFFGTNELELQWIEERDWEYRRTFNVPASLLNEDTVDLVADGLDTVATVRLNGRVVARTENMFVGSRWDVKKLLRAGANDLGGTLMEETISRMAGSSYGSYESIGGLEAVAAAAGRPARQRTTTYGEVPAERIAVGREFDGHLPELLPVLES